MRKKGENLQTQQTPKPEAQEPEATPPLLLHSASVDIIIIFTSVQVEIIRYNYIIHLCWDKNFGNKLLMQLLFQLGMGLAFKNDTPIHNGGLIQWWQWSWRRKRPVKQTPLFPSLAGQSPFWNLTIWKTLKTEKSHTLMPYPVFFANVRIFSSYISLVWKILALQHSLLLLCLIELKLDESPLAEHCCYHFERHQKTNTT